MTVFNFNFRLYIHSRVSEGLKNQAYSNFCNSTFYAYCRVSEHYGEKNGDKSDFGYFLVIQLPLYCYLSKNHWGNFKYTDRVFSFNKWCKGTVLKTISGPSITIHEILNWNQRE